MKLKLIYDLYSLAKHSRCLFSCASKHYENTPMQYTAIFHGCKDDNFQMKKVDNFLIVAQNIDRGYTLEPPQ